jgi:hypothetical protein
MAPFLDPPAGFHTTASGSSGGGGGVHADESFVLPAVIRFGGEVEVDEATGGLLYTFPSLQASAAAGQQQRTAPQQQQVRWL